MVGKAERGEVEDAARQRWMGSQLPPPPLLLGEAASHWAPLSSRRLEPGARGPRAVCGDEKAKLCVAGFAFLGEQSNRE